MAKENGADIQVVEHFALVHDISRINENYDAHHGEQSAKFVNSYSKWLNLDEHQLYLLTEACKYHSAGRIIPNVTIQTCWDADRLDLGRAVHHQLEHAHVRFVGERSHRDQSHRDDGSRDSEEERQLCLEVQLGIFL